MAISNTVYLLKNKETVTLRTQVLACLQLCQNCREAITFIHDCVYDEMIPIHLQLSYLKMEVYLMSNPVSTEL